METSTEAVSPLIAFTDGICWAVIYPYRSEHGLWKYYPMPEVDCVIVDSAGVNQTRVSRLVQAKAPPEGFRDIDRLVEALASIGCLISYPPHNLLVEMGVCTEQLLP
jgi:hypothetical protein